MSKLPLVSVKRYVKELDDALIVSFNAFDYESQLKLLNWVKNTEDLVKFYIALKNKDYILFKINGFNINPIFDEVAFNTKVKPIYVKGVDDIIETLNEYKDSTIYVKARLDRAVKLQRGIVKFYASDVKFIVADYDDETAKELLNEYNPLDLICYALGYKPTPEIKALILPRVLPLFKPLGLPVNVIQFTAPESGKTHTAKMLSQLTNSYHSLQFPSRAKLIGDARFNRYGLCYTYDALYIEEFDKISGKRCDEFKEDYEALLTGLETGKWQREKSSKSDIDYFNPVSFCLFGNVKNKTLESYDLNQYTENSREYVSKYLEELTDLNIEPFLARFCYVEVLREPISCMKYILYDENNNPQCLHSKVSRSVFKLLQEWCVKESVTKRQIKSRYDRHFVNLFNILRVLEIEIDDHTLEQLINGSMTFYEVFTDIRKSNKEETQIEEYEWDLSELVNGH